MKTDLDRAGISKNVTNLPIIYRSILRHLAEHVVATIRDEGHVLLHACLLAQLLVHRLNPSGCQY